MDIDQRKLKFLLKELENIRGRHTELISVYIPDGSNINKVAEQLSNEKSTAQNIKSKPVRKNVLAALEKLSAHLKGFQQTPKNGMALFCGNVATSEGVSDIELWEIIPPEPITVRLYRCDKSFILDHLQEAFREKEIYGLIVLDASESSIGLIKGRKIVPVKHMDSIVPGKTKAGGWSQARYARIREGMLNDFLKTIGKIATEKFQKEKDLKGIIVGGPGPVKDEFVNGEFLSQQMKEKIIGTVDTSYSGDPGLNEAVERAEDILAEASITIEKKMLERFFAGLRKNDGLVAYGLQEVVKALESGAVDILLLSENFELVEVHVTCKCGHSGKKIIKKNMLSLECPNCKGMMGAVEKDIMNELIKKAEDTQTKIEMISGDSPLGQQFQEIGGIGGILRFRID